MLAAFDRPENVCRAKPDRRRRAGETRAAASAALGIGPFDCPFLKGDRVRSYDVLDQAELQRLALAVGRDPAGCPPIAFTGDLGAIPDRFDLVVSSHAIEHQPDLVRQLQDVERLLVPGDAYLAIVPDMRICFDAALPLSTLDDVLAARGRSRHTPEAVLEQLHHSHNGALRHWCTPGAARPVPREAREIAEIRRQAEQAAGGDYVDVHAWRFTPASFAALLAQLRESGLTGLTTEAVHATAFGEQEFFARLVRPARSAT